MKNKFHFLNVTFPVPFLSIFVKLIVHLRISEYTVQNIFSF